VTNERLGPKASLGDIRMLLVIGFFGAIITFFLPICYLHLLISGCDASGSIQKRSAKVAAT
jgi:hypothetical protein